MTAATFPSRFRFVRVSSQRGGTMNQCAEDGLQIREGGFDSPTRLQYLADHALGEPVT